MNDHAQSVKIDLLIPNSLQESVDFCVIAMVICTRSRGATEKQPSESTVGPMIARHRVPTPGRRSAIRKSWTSGGLCLFERSTSRRVLARLFFDPVFDVDGSPMLA